MIVINKDNETTILILPALEKPYTTFHIELYSAFSKKNYSLELGELLYSNTRYSQFQLANAAYDSLPSGEYQYQFKGDAEVLTYGLLNVTANDDKVVYDSIIPPVEDNDFYVYSNPQ